MKIIAYSLKNGEMQDENNVRDYWEPVEDDDVALKRYKALLQQDDLYIASLCEIVDSTDYTPNPVVRAACLSSEDSEIPTEEAHVKDVARMAKKPPITKCLDLSTGHLTQETMQNPAHHLTAEYEYGAIFYVPEKISEDCEPDLAVVLKFAQQHGCDLVRFDNLNEVIDELPYFEW